MTIHTCIPSFMWYWWVAIFFTFVRQKSSFLPTEPQHRSWQRVVHSLLCWQLLQKLRVTDLFYQLTWTQQTTSCLLSSLHWKTAHQTPLHLQMMYWIVVYVCCLLQCFRFVMHFHQFWIQVLFFQVIADVFNNVLEEKHVDAWMALQEVGWVFILRLDI